MADTEPTFDRNSPCSPISVPASQTALLIMDFHSLILKLLPEEGQKAATTASLLRQWARDQKFTVIHCLIDFKNTPGPQSKMGSRAGQIHGMVAAQGPEIISEVAELTPAPDEYVFWRPLGQISALSSYGLKDFLQHYGINSVILSGVSSSGCVIDTAKAMTEAGKIVTVVEDACADREVETHRYVMDKLLVRQCHIATQEELSKVWK